MFGGQETGLEAGKGMRLLGMWLSLGYNPDLLVPRAFSTNLVLFKWQVLVSLDWLNFLVLECPVSCRFSIVLTLLVTSGTAMVCCFRSPCRDEHLPELELMCYFHQNRPH